MSAERGVTRTRWAGAAHRLVLSMATVGLGLTAHVLGGAPADWSCLPLVAASLAGVLATLCADRAAGYHSRRPGPAIALLGGGQLAMHLILAGAMSRHVAGGESVGLGLTCGLVAAHAAATAVLTVLLLGAQRTLDAVAGLLARVGGWLRLCFAGPPRLAAARRAPVAPRAVAAGVRIVRYGAVRPWRGPPILPVSASAV